MEEFPMIRTLCFVAIAALVGCGDDGVADTAGGNGNGGNGGSGPTTPGGCTNNVLDQHPASDEPDAYYRTLVDFRFAREDATATVSVIDGTVDSNGTRLWWTPSAPLTAGTSYVATLAWECEAVEVPFTVGSDPGAAISASDVAKKSYSMDLRAARFAAPEGIGDLLTSLLQFNLILGIESASDTELTLMAAVSDEGGAQDTCSPSIPFDSPADFGANPYFSVETDTLPIVVSGSTLNIDDLKLSGAFSADASTLTNVALSGIIDTRPLADAVGAGSDEGAVCDLFEGTFRISCEECPNGDGPYCIELVLDSIEAPDTGFSLQTITEADIDPDDCPEE
jgi:hypothetical protein